MSPAQHLYLFILPQLQAQLLGPGRQLRRGRVAEVRAAEGTELARLRV
jgi:hypothetical protein